MARYWVGTSGWSYANWRYLFYPKGLKQGEWIGFYSQHLNSVEVNATFYRPPQEKMLQGWAEKTPAEFVFAIKAWRTITHYRRLKDCAEPLESFLARLWPIRSKCGPVLFQLPPRFACDPARLEKFLKLLPEGQRFTMEFRDPSWHCEEVYALLRARNVAFCPFELASLRAPRVATADFVYLRLHGRKARYQGAYSERTLRDWAGWLGERLAEGRDAYVYFDNTDEADHAIKNARRLDELLAEAVA